MIASLARGLVLLGVGATVAILWWWLGAEHPLLAAGLTLPIAPALPGLLRGRPYTHAWASMLALPYLGLGLVEAYANPAARELAILLLGAAALWFVGCLLYVRGTRSGVDHRAQ